MSLTADDVTNVEFGTSLIGKRGYAKHEVDEFLARIERTLNGEDDLTAAEVHHVMFGKPLIGKRGYDEREVDVFLDEVEEELISRSGLRPQPLPGARSETEATLERAEPVQTARVEHFQES
ncbi:DivIVA domain-containing protein [Amycolatopsis minnesotensis]|uniref:Cell wall synthesis protein Wag31 n=1 Tax=Amycolatopsis minnesotensis TaxID=337894 RepID=A0ABN2SNR4_9PSEU